MVAKELRWGRGRYGFLSRLWVPLGAVKEGRDRGCGRFRGKGDFHAGVDSYIFGIVLQEGGR